MAEPARVAVTDSSPIIALCAIGQLRLLKALFDRVVVPMEVWHELTGKAGAQEPRPSR